MKITQAVWRKIEEATKNPSAFDRKAERKVLMASVDSAIEQITNGLFGKAARSHEQMIKRLNRLPSSHEKIKLGQAVLNILNHYKDLQSVSYDEDDDDFNELVSDLLNPLIDLTTYE